jgi:WD40 repeat protein
LRALVAVLLLATLGAFGLVAVAVNQSQIAQHNAAEAQNVALIAGSQSALANDNSDEAIALALQAVTLNPDSARAQVALGQAAYAPGTVRRFAGHTGEISGVAFSPGGHMALTSADDRRLILWDVATGAIIRQFANGHTEGHIKVDFSPDGGTALSGAGDGLVILWDVATGNIIRRFEGHTGWVRDVRFSPDG